MALCFERETPRALPDRLSVFVVKRFARLRDSEGTLRPVNRFLSRVQPLSCRAESRHLLLLICRRVPELITRDSSTSLGMTNHSGFSIKNRVLAAWVRLSYWLLKIGAGLGEMSS